MTRTTWRGFANGMGRSSTSTVAVMVLACVLGLWGSRDVWAHSTTGTTQAAPSAAAANSAQSMPSPAAPNGTQGAPAGGPKGARHTPPERFARHAEHYYRMVWGIDSLVVQWAESGDVVKFTYHVLDAKRAVVLGDKKYEPSLEDPQAGVKLVVPAMENIGKLRQSGVPEGDKSYWVVFSNKGRPVKRGHHVNVVIGPFRANNLVVD